MKNSELNNGTQLLRKQNAAEFDNRNVKTEKNKIKNGL